MHHAHRKDIGRSPVQDNDVPTPDDVIRWLEEQAFSSGKIGFSTVFQPDRISKLTHMDLSADVEPTYREITVIAAMEAGKEQWEREQYILKKMHQHQRVVKQAEEKIEKRLLLAGMSPQDLNKLNSKKVGVRQKFIKLYNLENPPPKGPQRVTVKIMRQTETGTQLQEAYLSVEDTLDDIRPILSSLSATMSGRGELQPSRGEGSWMYQLIEQAGPKWTTGVPPEGLKRPLLVDADWRDLVKILSKKGSKPPSAVLFQESTLNFSRELNVNIEDEAWNAILDEDGSPYFEEVDWDKLLDKNFGEVADAVKSKAKTAQVQPTTPRRSARLSGTAPVKQK